MRVVLLYTPAGGGHRAAANAIAQELRDQHAAEVEIRDVLEFAPRWFAYDRAWQLIQHHGAHAWDWLFDTTDRGALDLDPVRLPLHRALFAQLDRFLLARRPTHIVCTHYLPAVAAARVAPQIGARTLVTITDHSPHRAWLIPGIDAYAVADHAVARAVSRRCPTAEVHVTGIPIARAAAAPVRAVASQLVAPRVLALLGGVPRADALATIDALAGTAATLHVLTGEDAAVVAHAARVLPRAERAPRANGLVAAIDAADVVITKAGGLTVSECLARGRAMVLPFAAPGQERGNRDYAVAAGAAVRPLEIADCGALIAELTRDAGTLRKMGARARLASHPHAAADVVTALRGAAMQVQHVA